MDAETLSLEGKSTIIRAEELHAKMEELLMGGVDVSVDLSAVEQIDTSALQLLLGFQRAFKEQDRKLQWVKPSETVLSAVKLTGLGPVLGMS